MLIGRGFADPDRDAQSAFRRILWAMSNPGDIVDLDFSAEPPEGLPVAAGAVLLALADVDTPIWLPAFYRKDWQRWLAFHTGATPAASAESAALAVIHPAREDLLPTDFNAGEDRYPDRSTTVLVVCDALDGGTAIKLSGPGINGARSIQPRGPDARFWRAVMDNNALYPRGVDVLLVTGSRMLALPRSLNLCLLEQRPCM